jgi:hypothetical protein
VRTVPVGVSETVCNLSQAMEITVR